jgi:transcription termination/antitermination protein NusA
MYVLKKKVMTVDSKAFKKAVENLYEEKGIKEEVIFEAMELALTSAYKKNYNSLSNVRVDINRKTGDIKVYSVKTVVKNNYVEVEDEETEDKIVPITLKEAKKIVPTIKVGETIEEEVTPYDFGRVAASTAKQVVIQKMREAERNNIVEEFTDKQDELMVGIVAMEDARNYYIDLGRTQGILPKTETIPGETIKMGSSVKVYVSKVEMNSKGPLILLSRNHYGFIKRLFELEIPEINDGTILVYSVAREPGIRSKIAVYSENPRVDAIGSCIGERGSRIANILKELGGEKLDIIPYDKDTVTFIKNALSPAKDTYVFILDEKKTEALVIVNDENLSLAIGKKGINVRLASRLTHHKLDVKTYEQAKEMGINIVENK